MSLTLGRSLAVAGHASLDAPLSDDGADALIDRLPADAGSAPDAAVIDDTLTRTVGASLAALRPREQRVLRLYFGFDGEPLTLEQIGALLGVTRERVRQIKEKALTRIRLSRAARPLAELR